MSQYDVSEAVARGHPDKVADQIADAILDALLQQDPYSRAAIEAMVSHRLVAVGGEISTEAHINVEEVVRHVLSTTGYDSAIFGNLAKEAEVISSITKQSPDIAHGVGETEKLFSSICAGDQGMMFGYACQDTPTFMPKSFEMARTIVSAIEHRRTMDEHSIFGPDGKTLVAIRGNAATVVVSWQHLAEADLSLVREQLTQIIHEIGSQFSVRLDQVLANPAGKFVLGGPFADTGLTGRKQIVDSYGGSVHHGGGSYSGKDATKVDRSGAYMARYIAKHVVAAQLAQRCEVQLVFSIAQEKPLCLSIDCFGTEKIPLPQILAIIEKTFPLTVSGIIRELDLTKPVYQQTACGGHFGRDQFPWERLVRLEMLKIRGLPSGE